jgi:hypothetical protein
MASSAKAEQVGVKRHAGGNTGDTNRLYSPMVAVKNAPIGPMAPARCCSGGISALPRPGRRSPGENALANKEGPDLFPQGPAGSGNRPGSCDQQNVDPGEIRAVKQLPLDFPQNPFGPVPAHRRSDLAACHDGKPTSRAVGPDVYNHDIRPPQHPTLTVDPLEIGLPDEDFAGAHPGSRQETTSRFRPLARRFFRTLRPLALLIRLRKPWTLSLRRLCG